MKNFRHREKGKELYGEHPYTRHLDSTLGSLFRYLPVTPSAFLFLCVQVYDDKDYRRIRFVGRQKEVNENFAIDLIAEQPVSEVETRVIACDGGGGALGHPKVYINLDKETKTGMCGYCGLQFRQHHH
ncbi:NADH dehydrogenase [ubiquinone] iron-sulfur protein 6, mitochondrial [Hylobates moloch]|uniref:NADH dehydrogenase [ubiquinone] iron-sulfur protein 6, mitochondrial n=1 Tax=Hylobates moloch TaxID=81572 RepID=UPI00136257C1|nr:NADH dehydrogenase [ubiquinone] iron-sulfur protein 6, mitochondrial [Hylobates moloch]